MSAGNEIAVWVNPLAFLAAEEPWASMDGQELSVESILEFLSQPDETVDLDRIAERCRELDSPTDRLHFVPLDERVLDKMVWPLRNAKASYMLGNFLSTIALAGMVAEMVAILRWEMGEPQINGAPVTGFETDLLGTRFEKLGQERRVKVLKALDLCEADDVSAFDEIRRIRKQYLHFWSQDHNQLARDAVAAYRAAVQLVARAIGQDLHDGRLLLNPTFARYLERQDIVTIDESDDGDALAED
jgi:hypothetical protein